MSINNDMNDDAIWNALEDLIKAYLQGRIRTVHDDGNIDFRMVPERDVHFCYSYNEMFVTDNKLNEFVKNIMLTLRDK